MIKHAKQLTLPIALRYDARFDNFLPGNNDELIMQLLKMAMGEGENFLYFWGNSGTGRSHLLYATCHTAFQHKKSCVYLPFKEILAYTPAALDELDNIDVVCIDDFDRLTADPSWERSLFNLFNDVMRKHNRLIISADRPPIKLALQLPDLRSRLQSGLCLMIHPLTDLDKINVLKNYARECGINLADNVLEFLTHRCSRNLADLIALLKQLDETAIQQQHRVTIPFAKTVLGI